MNTRLTLLLITFLCLSACSDRPEIKPLSQHNIPKGAKLLLAPGVDPNYALCCGSCNSNNECENCAILPPLSECSGTILACPEGEIITDDGVGGCA